MAQKLEKSNKRERSEINEIKDGCEDIRLHVSLPMYEYTKCKTSFPPLDRKRTNDLRFDSIESALSYIRGHCMFHFGRFSQSLARQYLRDCSVYDPLINFYVIQENVSLKSFRRAFKIIDRWFFSLKRELLFIAFVVLFMLIEWNYSNKASTFQFLSGWTNMIEVGCYKSCLANYIRFFIKIWVIIFMFWFNEILSH